MDTGLPSELGRHHVDEWAEYEATLMRPRDERTDVVFVAFIAAV